MRGSTPRFTPEQKSFFTEIGAAIAARPDFYRAGIEYLGRRFSTHALYTEALQSWERDRQLDPSLAKPDPDKGFALSNCLIHAFSTLLNEGLDTPDDDLNPYDHEKAKAVLCLTWLLTDKNANLHPLGERFGPWLAGQHEYAARPRNEMFALELEAKGRAIARIATLDELNGECRARWMALVRRAWVVLRQSAGRLADGCRGDANPIVGAQAAPRPELPASGSGTPDEPLSKEAKALAALADHPDWTDRQVAKAAGCQRSSLYRMARFMAAKRILKDGKDLMPEGKKDGKDGAVEAWDGGGDDE